MFKLSFFFHKYGNHIQRGRRANYTGFPYFIMSSQGNFPIFCNNGKGVSSNALDYSKKRSRLSSNGARFSILHYIL